MSNKPDLTLDDLLEDFDVLEEWDERYNHIIELGKKLTPIPEKDQLEENEVDGCMSTVWLVADKQTPEQLDFSADSDALIVRGLVAILLILFSGKSPDEILQIEPESLFAQLGLSQQLSPQRRNGLFSMVKRVKQLAVEATQA